MIHCYATQEVTAKPEPQSQRAQSYYHMATTNGQPQQQQDHRQHHPQQQQHHHHHHQQQQPQLVECCPVCNHQLPCSCTGYHKAASNDFYATSNQQQQQQQQSDPSRASLTSNRQAATSGHHIQQQSHQTSPNHQSATNGSGGSHHHNQHHHHHQHGASLTQISPSAGADNNNDNLLIEPQCSAKTTEHPAGQTADSKQTAQQTDELYGRLYDIEPKRAQPQQHPQQSAWGEHFQFPLSPAASLRPQDSDYLHHDINRDLATSSVSPSGSRLQEGAQAYRRPTSAESAKQQSCPLNDFNNNNNNRPVQDGAADEQQASASLSFAPLMPIIETSSLEHMQTDQRDTTNEQDFYHQHHYNSSTADYLSCFGDNNNTGQQREQVAVESVEKGDKLADDEHHHRYTNDMSNHHQPLGRIGANLASHHYGRHQHQQQHSHQQQQHQHQQEHSPSSSTSSACSNLAAGNSIVTEQSNEFYSHHQYQSQTQPQYSQAMGMEQNQYNGELTSPTHTTTPGCGQQQQQQQQQVALFQDYYNYTTCDPNATATSQPARQPQQQPQQYHGQQDVSSYQDNYSQLQEAQFRGVTEQDGRATTISYEAPKTALYQQVPVDTISSVGGQLMLISPQDVPTVDYNQQASATTNTTVSVESQPTSGANANQSAIRATSKTTPGSTKPPLSRTRRGRPRKKSGHSKGKVSGKLWEFIRDLLLSERTNPSFIRWERREDGVFKFVQSDKVAKMWGERKQNPKMTYEKLSRAMRYYYKSKVLLPVFGRRLVYKFGPNATGWMCPSSSAESSPTHSAHSHHNNSIQTQDLDIEHNHQTHHHLLHSYQPHSHDHDHHHISPQHHHSAHNNHQDLLDHRAASLAAHGANFSQDAIIY